MALTPLDTIKATLLENYDPNYYDSIYRQMCYSFGEPAKRSGGGGLSSGGNFPDYPDIFPRLLEVGRSRGILNTQLISLAKTMTANPQPEFPQVDKWIGEVRKQFYLARFGAGAYGHGDSDWSEDLASTFMDADGFGEGHVFHGLETNPQSGFQRVTIRHISTLHTIRDRHARKLSHARNIAFIKYLSPEAAVSLFGSNIKNKLTALHDPSGAKLTVLRIVEYYDRGSSKHEPTRAILLRNLCGDELLREPNKFGILPWSYMTMFPIPGMRYHLGRVPLQMATQEAINDIERMFRKIMKRAGVDIFDADQINAEDLKKLQRGLEVAYLRYNPKPNSGVPYHRVPAQEIAASMIQQWQMLKRQQSDDSGINEMDRGSLSEQSRTLGENQLLDARSQRRTAWSALRAHKLHRRTAQVSLEIAKKFDKDPLTIDYFGLNVSLNDPKRPDSYLENFLAEPSTVIMGDETIRQSDARLEGEIRMRQLKHLEPYVGKLFDPVWYAEELARAIGEQDPKGIMLGGGQSAAAPTDSMMVPTMLEAGVGQ